MGTKANPGPFDCYAKAEPDEPLFVLLARDRHAPLLVTLWAELRQAEGEPEEVTDEASDCAIAMMDYQRAHGRAALAGSPQQWAELLRIIADRIEGKP